MRSRTTLFLAALGLAGCVSVPPPAGPAPDIAPPIVAPPKPAVIAPDPLQPTAPVPSASVQTTAPAQPSSPVLAPAPPKPRPPAPTPPKPVAPAVVTPPPTVAAPAASPTLDLASLEQRLRDTKAIGVFTKLSLKNQVDDLLADFRTLYKKSKPPPGPAFRQRYDLLLLKVLTLLQDADPPLAAAITSSKEAIWSILADPDKLAKI
jgi:hypothetical protein